MKPSIYSFDTRIGDREFPLRIRRMEPQNPTELHAHEFAELVAVYGGEGEHFDPSGSRLQLSRGDVFLVEKGQSHRYGEGSLRLVNVLFDLHSLPMPLLDASSMPGFHSLFSAIRGGRQGEGPFSVFKVPDEPLEALCGAISELERELLARSPGYRFASISHFMRIAVLLSRQLSASPAGSTSLHSGLSEAMNYMHRHFTEPVEISKLASASHMSMSTLLRRFKRMNGCSPKEYLLRLRINCASELLLTTDLDIRDVGLRSGFEDSNYFSREFKRAAGSPPGKFRRLLRGS